MENKDILNVNELLSKYDLNSADMTYKELIKVLNNLIISRSVDLDILEMKLYNIEDKYDQYNKTNIEIYNLSSCLMKIKTINNYRKKVQFKKKVKKLIPFNK